MSHRLIPGVQCSLTLPLDPPVKPADDEEREWRVTKIKRNRRMTRRWGRPVAKRKWELPGDEMGGLAGDEMGGDG